MPENEDYFKKVKVNEMIKKEPQLVSHSNYQVNFMEGVKQPKEIQMIRTHNIV